MKKLAILACLALLAACTTVKQSDPARTATEEMLISTAADRAAGRLAAQMPTNARVYLDTTNFEGTDAKYAIGAIRGSLLARGIALVDDRKNAGIVIEARAGALSTDNESLLIGIPSFSVPVPLSSSSITTPELALYKSQDQKGVAKFAVNTYGAKSMRAVEPMQDTEYGFADHIQHTILFFISWDTDDAVPDEDNGTAGPAAPAENRDRPLK